MAVDDYSTSTSFESAAPPIVEHRVEPTPDGFRLVIRRGWDATARITLIVLLLFAGIGLYFMIGFAMAFAEPILDRLGVTQSEAKPDGKGAPICCFPFILAFFALWLRVPLLSMKRLWDSLRGREVWTFTPSEVIPWHSGPDEAPSLIVGHDCHAGVFHVGKKWGVGITASGWTVHLGPFPAEPAAQRLADELRWHRPEWFTGPAGNPLAYGRPAVQPEQAFWEPIVAYEVQPAVDGLDIVLERRRTRSRAGKIGFLIVWCCGWAVGEVLVATLLIRWLLGRLDGAPVVEPIEPGGRSSSPPMIFLAFWLTFWTIGGIWAIRQLVVLFRTRERWHITHEQVVAGPFWQQTTRRRLSTTTGLLARRVHDARQGHGIELIADGQSIYLGPFDSEQLIDEFTHTLRGHRLHWQWEPVEAPKKEGKREQVDPEV